MKTLKYDDIIGTNKYKNHGDVFRQLKNVLIEKTNTQVFYLVRTELFWIFEDETHIPNFEVNIKEYIRIYENIK
jgi:protein associated with RNAse G/E